jgi:hypothetical protein
MILSLPIVAYKRLAILQVSRLSPAVYASLAQLPATRSQISSLSTVIGFRAPRPSRAAVKDIFFLFLDHAIVPLGVTIAAACEADDIQATGQITVAPAVSTLANAAPPRHVCLPSPIQPVVPARMTLNHWPHGAKACQAPHCRGLVYTCLVTSWLLLH